MEIEFVLLSQGNGEAAGNSAVVRKEIEGAAVDMVGVSHFHEMTHDQPHDELSLMEELSVHVVEYAPEAVAPLLDFESLHGHKEVEQELDANVMFQLLHRQLIRSDDGEQQVTGQKPVLVFISICRYHCQRKLWAFNINFIFGGAMPVEEISIHYFEQQA